MRKLLLSRSFHVLLALAVIGFIIFMVIGVRNNQPIEYITAVVERGDVQQLVSVSGVIEAEQSADLAFPTSGIVSEVLVDKGDVVAAGDVLIVLEARALQADRQDALAARARAVATRDELQAGADPNQLATSIETVSLKEATLETTIATQADLVNNAYRALLSSGLSATSDDPDEEAVAPTISGTYNCDTEGTYTIDMYASGANSGYSYRLSGIESGTFTASVDQATELGSCGLRAIFDADSRYTGTTWTIDIPNKKSSLYVANRNAYTLAQTQSDSAIALATQDIALAQATANSANAPARSEAIARANADIASANARLARVDAQIADRTLRAPFAGTITDIDILPGETVTNAPVVTVLAAADFELTARIPEIDIGKLEVGQRATIAFDARSGEYLSGTIDFISLQATEIDGVAYYEAIITLDTTPTWMRSGLNADIDIVVLEATDVLRLPTRFIDQSTKDGAVRTKTGELIATSTIDILLKGDDGYIAFTGLNEGDIVIAQ